MTATSRDEVTALLEPLIREAERTGQWLRCSYQDITMSPAELRKYNREGQFCWGPVNWTLFDPKTLLQSPEDAKSKAIAHNEQLIKRGVKP